MTSTNPGAHAEVPLTVGPSREHENRKWSPKEKFVFIPIFLFTPTLLVFALLAGVDIWLHEREIPGRNGFNTLNIWGYRGSVAPPREDGQLRVAVVGGSTAWGYGVPVNESMPKLLEVELKRKGLEKAIVMNLAFNNEGAHAFRANLEDYFDLDYDLVVMYTGVNDSGGENRLRWRRNSEVFRETGYLPILPSLIGQAISNLRSGRSASNNPDHPKIVFDPNFQENVRETITSGGLDTYLREQQSTNEFSLPREIEYSEEPASAFSPGASPPLEPSILFCQDPWSFYCTEVGAAIDFVLQRGKRVLLVSEPYVASNQVEQQAQLRDYLRTKYPGNLNLTYVDFGLAVDVTNPLVAFDGMHLTSRGNQSIATRLANLIVELERSKSSNR